MDWTINIWNSNRIPILKTSIFLTGNEDEQLISAIEPAQKLAEFLGFPDDSFYMSYDPGITANTDF